MNYIWSYGLPVQIQSAGKSPTVRWSDGLPYVVHVYESASNNYTLSCDSVSYDLTGFDTNLLKNFTLSCDSTNYNLIGFDTNLLKNFTLSCDSTNYNLIGFGANLRLNSLPGISKKLFLAKDSSHFLLAKNNSYAFTSENVYL